MPSIDKPAFLQWAFEKTARDRTFSDPLEELLCSEFIEISRDFDLTQIQDSWSWRNVHTARELAILLIDEKGEIKRPTLMKAIEILEENRFSFGPYRYHDHTRLTHVLKMLHLFSEEQEAIYALKRIGSPQRHRGVSNLIRSTLLLPDSVRMSDAHARRAALSALLTTLRQNVGSCFATAPAIMIQQEQPLQFLADIGRLFGTGRLTRIYEGVEYAVPLSLSWGVGDLIRPVFLAALGADPVKALAFSPGLQAGFESSGLIGKNLCREARQKAVEGVIRESGGLEGKPDPFTPFTADEVFKRAFLNAYGLKEEEVKEFQEKPPEGFVGEVILQAPHFREGKAGLIDLYTKNYEKAKEAFKALADNPLLKSWEFTLASLSESRADFAKWNLYESLGVQPSEPHGIGRNIEQHLQQQIDRINAEVEELSARYDHLYAQVKYLEGRMRRASTPTEAEWLRADYRHRAQEINRLLSERDEAHEKGRKLVNLFPFMINFFGKKIRDYFQEVYDPQMHDLSANLYDDSPAGFRLLYKHGRANPALWTMIHSSSEYINCLNAFFVAIENELRAEPETEGLESELSELVTIILTTIKQPEFLESSFFRLARRYNEPIVKNPLENLGYVKRKPWAYISGGTMSTLTSCYYSNSAPPKEESRWVENENELLAFFIDTLKGLPLSTQEIFRKDSARSMLAYSPTHAFLLKPGWSLFRKAWESDLYTYTWIRDIWHHPQLNFLDDHILDSRMMGYLVDELLHLIPPGYRPLVKKALKSLPFSMRSNEFREYAIKALSYEKWLRAGSHLALISEEIDSLLYRCMPLFPEHALKERLNSIFDTIDEIDSPLRQRLFEKIDNLEVGRYKILSSKDLRKIAKGLLMIELASTRSSVPFHERITDAMRAHRYAYPEPILFADTNWVKNTFGFIVNPGTGNLELWRFDDCGSEGHPISIWRRYLDGTDRLQWGLYSAPNQYGQFTK
ncbi:MAG: hypothetical protein JJU12_02735 [Chlamydiales bacterium]|nr:hypothetical protein [Chlamydiales bacterium]